MEGNFSFAQFNPRPLVAAGEGCGGSGGGGGGGVGGAPLSLAAIHDG